MAKISFREQPLIVKLAVLATFYNAWVLFEELVIDRYGIWRYLPLYEKGYFCIWDIAAILVIGLIVLGFALPLTLARRDCVIRRYLHRCALCA